MLITDVIMAFDRYIAVFRWSTLDQSLVEYTRYDTSFQPLLMTYIGPKKPVAGVLAEMKPPMVIILTKEDFQVTCLSYPELEVRWTTPLPSVAWKARDLESILGVAEHAMVADYTALYKGDDGAVFVTLRFGYQSDITQSQGLGADFNDVKVDQETMKTGDKANKKKDVAVDPDLQGQFDKADQRTVEFLTEPMFYALDLMTGKIRWKTTAQDLHSRQSLHDADADAYGDDDQEEMSQTAHDYRRHIAERATHFGEGNWRIWKPDLIERALPHQWYTMRHTSLIPERFAVNKDEANARRGRRNVPGFATGEFEDPYHYLSRTYQHASAKSSNNVLLYEHSGGITVIHLYTGRVLTRLQLPPFRTYADANGDYSINSVLINEEAATVHMSTMFEEFRTVNHSQVYTAKLPVVGPALQRIHGDAAPDAAEFAPPLLIRSNTRFSAAGTTSRVRSQYSTTANALGKTIAQILPDLDNEAIPEKAYFMIFLNSFGTMYCMRSDNGELQWAIDTNSGWASLQSIRSAIFSGFSGKIREAVETEAKRDEIKLAEQSKTAYTTGNADMKGRHELKNQRLKAKNRGNENDPLLAAQEAQSRGDKRLSAHLMPFSIDSKETHPAGFLAVTPTGIVLVAPDGNILAHYAEHLPSVSKTTLPIVADINNDGRNDIIIATHRAYHIYTLTSGKSHVYPLLVACFLLILVGVAIFKVIDARAIRKEIGEALGNEDRTAFASAEVAFRTTDQPVQFLKAE